MVKGNKNSTGLALPGSKAVKTLFTVGVALLLLSGFVFWKQVMNSPSNVFKGMLENSLKTTAVSRHTVQQSGVQTLDQITASQNGEAKVAHSLSDLSQSGDQTASVKTESIGTPFEDYVRYISIDTVQTALTGDALNFSDVLNIWGRTDAAAGETSGELYGESMLGIVPIGYVPADERQEILNLVAERNIYSPNLNNVKEETINGRPVYTYDVEVNPADYVEMLKKFAAAVGLNQLETFQPENFRNSPKIQFKLSIDVWSRQLVKAEFVGSGRVETYSAYGAKPEVQVPEDYITVEELQTRLQSVQ